MLEICVLSLRLKRCLPRLCRYYNKALFHFVFNVLKVAERKQISDERCSIKALIQNIYYVKPTVREHTSHYTHRKGKMDAKANCNH